MKFAKLLRRVVASREREGSENEAAGRLQGGEDKNRTVVMASAYLAFSQKC